MSVTRKPRNREQRTKKRPLESCPIPLGKPLGIHDRHGVELCGGDLVRLYQGNSTVPDTYQGRILEYGNCCVHMFPSYSMWYPPFNEFVPESYGKLCVIPLDDGKRMDIERIAGF